MNKNIAKLNQIRLENQIKSDISKESQKDVLLLSAGENADELQVLRDIGLDNHLSKELKKESKNNEFKLLSDKFNRNVYKGSDIKKLCYDYNLTILMARDYKGPVSLDIAKEIIKLQKEHLVTVKRHENAKEFEKSEISLSHYNFFILTDNFDKGTSVTLFYREGKADSSYGDDKVRENDLLIEVASFGKPFSEARFLHSIGYSSSMSHIFFFILTFITFVVGLFGNSVHWILLIFMIVTSVANLFTDDDQFEQYWNRSQKQD